MNGNLKHFNSGQGDLSPAAELQIIFSFPALLQSLSSENSLLCPHRSGKCSMCSQGNEYFPYILLLDHWPRILSPGFLLRHDDVLQNRTDHCGVLRGWPGPPRTGLNFRPKGHFPLIHDNMVQTTFYPNVLCHFSFYTTVMSSVSLSSS